MTDTESKTVPKDGQEHERYEVGFHLVATLAEEKVASTVTQIASLIEEAGGVIVERGEPKPLQLAYTVERKKGGAVEKHNQSYFGWLHFTAAPQAAESVRIGMQEIQEILRFLVVKIPVEENREKRRSVFKQEPKQSTTREESPRETVSEEDLDKEIDKLVGS